MNDIPNINVSEGKWVTFSEDEYEAMVERETILRFGKAISQNGKIIFKIWELDDYQQTYNRDLIRATHAKEGFFHKDLSESDVEIKGGTHIGICKDVILVFGGSKDFGEMSPKDLKELKIILEQEYGLTVDLKFPDSYLEEN